VVVANPFVILFHGSKLGVCFVKRLRHMALPVALIGPAQAALSITFNASSNRLRRRPRWASSRKSLCSGLSRRACFQCQTGLEKFRQCCSGLNALSTDSGAHRLAVQSSHHPWHGADWGQCTVSAEPVQSKVSPTARCSMHGLDLPAPTTPTALQESLAPLRPRTWVTRHSSTLNN